MMLIVVCDWLQRALPMRVITVGKARSIGVQNIALEYTKKIQHYCRFEDVQVRSNPKNTRHGLPPTITTTAATIFPILDAVLFCWFIGDGVVLCIAKWMDSFIFITPSLIMLGFFSPKNHTFGAWLACQQGCECTDCKWRWICDALNICKRVGM